MSNQLDTTTQRLRELILAGDVEPGQRLGEVAAAHALAVSRTLARLAMAALENEGLLVREPNRGFRVRTFTVAEVADAIEVRGELEGMAARLAAERGIDGEMTQTIEGVLEEAERLTETGLTRAQERIAWIGCNARFHDCLVQAAGNQALSGTIDHIARVPLAGPRAIVFDRVSPERTVRQIRMSNDDHRRIHDAIHRRQGTRAEALLREHAHRSAQNKRENFTAMSVDRLGVRLPGANLVT